MDCMDYYGLYRLCYGVYGLLITVWPFSMHIYMVIHGCAMYFIMYYVHVVFVDGFNPKTGEVLSKFLVELIDV